MLVSLLKYEFTKKWKSVRYLLLGYGVIELTLLLITKILLWKDSGRGLFINNTSMNDIGPYPVFTMVFFLLIAGAMFIFPFLQGVYAYEKDLTGKQATLELMIPVHASKKVTSKLISTVCGTIICGIISLFSLFMFFFVMSNFSKSIIDTLNNILREVLNNPGKTLYVILAAFFSYASLYLIFFFCIAVSKWVSHKNKIAVPISIGIFAVFIVINALLEMKIDSSFQQITFTVAGIKNNLASTVRDIVVFALAFIGTSWVMEKKIEN
ncbi:MAG: hypothetical protein Q8936_02825 [Bacillota bacterium]|nr:hypothetical protein [Bacillota bacterium]